MRGTLLCAVTEDDETSEALALGAEVSERLDLRLVLAQLVESDGSRTGGGRQGAERRLARLTRDHGVTHRAETRVAVGEPAALLGRIAAEEAADVIVVGARSRGWRKRLESRLAEELETETPVPVVIAPPRRSRP